MTDTLTPGQRRLNMSRIRGKDTKPEMIVRRALHARGLRYRLHDRKLPGRPDLVLPRYRAVIFVHGCFWHGHACASFHLPRTRAEFWATKICGNQTRDVSHIDALIKLGWRVIVIWECVLRGTTRIPENNLVDTCQDFLIGSDRQYLEIPDSC